MCARPPWRDSHYNPLPLRAALPIWGRRACLDLFGRSPCCPCYEKRPLRIVTFDHPISRSSTTTVELEEEEEEVVRIEIVKEVIRTKADMSDTYEPHDRVRTDAHISTVEDYKAKYVKNIVIHLLKTKSGGRFQEGSWVVGCVGRGFCLERFLTHI